MKDTLKLNLPMANGEASAMMGLINQRPMSSAECLVILMDHKKLGKAPLKVQETTLNIVLDMVTKSSWMMWTVMVMKNP